MADGAVLRGRVDTGTRQGERTNQRQATATTA
jgi:hypothetical protein